MIKVKICGITNLEDALFCSEQGADALGFIFVKASQRYITAKKAAAIAKQLGPFITKVGVFVDEDKDSVLNIARGVNLDVLQFHGRESAAYCKAFQPEFAVIKVLFPQDSPLAKAAAKYNGIDAFLFDVKLEDKKQGISKLSEGILEEASQLIKKGHRVIISAGLNPENISRVKKMLPYALDVASGVEKTAGRKDKNLVTEFIRKIKTV